MTHIPVMVMVVDDVMPSGSIDVEGVDEFGKITCCHNCGGILFYQRVSRVEKTKHATDTEIYCAQCGQLHSGMFNDPFNEMKQNFDMSYDPTLANYIIEGSANELGPNMEWICIDTYPYEKFEENRLVFLKQYKYFRFREVNPE